MSGLWAVLLAATAMWVALRPGQGWPRAPGQAAWRAPGNARAREHGLGPEGSGDLLGTVGRMGRGTRSARVKRQQEGRGPLTEDDAALLLELAATLLDAGLPVTRILQCLADEIPGCLPLRAVVRSLELGLDWDRAWAASPPALARLGEALAFAHLTGAATAGLLKAAAEQQRHAADRAAEHRAAELAVKMVVPLGLCALPAFICLGIIPVVIALLPQLR